MFRKYSTKHILLVTVVAVALGASHPAFGHGISSGLDLFRSNDEDGNSLGAAVDLTAFGLGVVDLMGDPFGFGGFDDVDTIVSRKQGIDPFDWPFAVGTVDIELVALSLRSIDSIDLGPVGFPGKFADLHTIINTDGIIDGLPQPKNLPASLGSMEIRHEDANGGTFDSVFGAPGDPVPASLADLLVAGGGVTAEAIFTVPGGDPAIPGDVIFSMPADRLVIWSQDSTWGHFLGAGFDFDVLTIDHDCSAPQCHPVEPIPEPTSLVLLALGGLTLARRQRRISRRPH